MNRFLWPRDPKARPIPKRQRLTKKEREAKKKQAAVARRLKKLETIRTTTLPKIAGRAKPSGQGEA